MGSSVFRAIKIVLVCLAIAAGVAIVLKTIPFLWWCGALTVLTTAYWSIISRDPWVSPASLRKLGESIHRVEKSRPDWIAPKRSVSSSGTTYFAIALLLLFASQFDYSTATGRGVFFKSLAPVISPLSIQLLLISVGTALLFWSYETIKAVQRHISQTGQIRDDESR